MSERIYTWLLRLYPSRFRRTYGDEALQLFRDRACHERGFLAAARLWLDLLADLALSLPREHRRAQPELTGVSASVRLDGVPSFCALGRGGPRFRALLAGGALSLVALGTFPGLIGYLGRHATYSAMGERLLGRSEVPEQPALPAQAEDGAGVSDGRAKKDARLDAAERRRVVAGAVANLKEHYVDPAVAQRMAEALLAHEKRGDYDAVGDGQAFAELLTAQMREASHDPHLELVYSGDLLPERPAEPTPEDRARYRRAMQQANCTFEKVEILPHNIGYLKFNFFPEPSVCKATAEAAMAKLNQVDALIFDLRDNRGGMPEMVELIAAYLFDHPEYWYNPRENTTERSWTHSPVPGSRLADKPVYVLTSARTLSGAEQFCYDLKMLKRATLVGETTGGAAHAGVFHRIDEHFGIGVPETKPFNPFSKADWDGTGVEPDVRVKATNALETAESLARRRLQER